MKKISTFWLFICLLAYQAAFTQPCTKQALSFDGGNWVEIPDHPTLRPCPTCPFTVEVWVLRESGNEVQHILGKRIGCDEKYDYYQIVFDPYLGFGSSKGAADTKINLPLYEWHHLSAVFDGAEFRFYCDGVLVASGSGPIGDGAGTSLLLGASGDCYPSYFTGKMDNVRIWNVARTQEEIQADRFGCITGTEPGLVGAWDFDEGRGDIAYDLSPNHNDGILVNSPAWVATTLPCCDEPPLDADGRIYMGGLNGVNALEGKTTGKPRVLLAKFSLIDAFKDKRIFLNPKSYAGRVKLSPSVISFDLQLAFTNFIDPAKNQYAWRMDGLDEDWSYVRTQNIASYLRMPPGSYTFRAKAADSFGTWSENELVLRITVLRPWYVRWWAWLMYVSVAVAGLYFLRKYQIRVLLERAEKRRLQELDAFKSRFYTNITHEFRTPLTVILGNLEIEKLEIEKLGNPGDPKISQFLNFLSSKNTIIHRNSESLLRLINQILDLAKLEDNSLKINYVHGDVLPYLRYVAESLQSLANAQNVMLRVESDQAKIEMDYDPERLLQIVHNLLSNAIKFTPSGGKVILRVGTDLAGFQNLPSLNLAISDTGVGIPPEDLPKIFDRFYQANKPHLGGWGAAKTDPTGAVGTGIGLSLTKELVKAMGGTISVESCTSPLVDRGAGTVFTVRLPITLEALPLTPKGEPNLANSAEFLKEIVSTALPEIGSPLGVRGVSHEGNPSILQSSNPSILLIEDNPDVVEYLTACLGEHYLLDFAYNGRSGIEKALETVPDLIVSDVMMPEKDGFEVCEFLKNDERTSHIPIVLLTAKADMESRIAGLRRGADAYLAKPFQREELLVVLQNLLELRKKLQARYSDFGFVISDFGRDERVASEIRNPKSEIAIEDAFLKKLNAVIEKHLSDAEFEVPQLCRAIHLSQPQLYRKIKALTDKSIASYIRTVRLHKGRELLKNSALNVSEVAYQVGFTDPAYFSRTFSEEFGFAPSDLRK